MRSWFDKDKGCKENYGDVQIRRWASNLDNVNALHRFEACLRIWTSPYFLATFYPNILVSEKTQKVKWRVLKHRFWKTNKRSVLENFFFHEKTTKLPKMLKFLHWSCSPMSPPLQNHLFTWRGICFGHLRPKNNHLVTSANSPSKIMKKALSIYNELCLEATVCV